MQLNRLFLIIGLCATSVLSAPRPSGQEGSFIPTPREGAVDWNTPRDNGSFLAKRANMHSEEWFNSRGKVRREDDKAFVVSKRDSWQDLTGPNHLVSYPTGVSWGGQREDLFHHERNTNVCKHFSFDGVTWSSGDNLGGSFDSSFGASCWGTGHIDTYGKGTDGACWHTSYGSSSGWNSWGSLGGDMVYEPSTVTWGVGFTDVFVISASDGECWHRAFSGGTWASWENIGGSIGFAPESCTWGSGHISVFVIGTDGQCWHRMWLTSKGGWSNWEALGGTITGPVTSVAWNGNLIDIFVRGTDNHCWHRRYHGDLNEWDAWENLGGNLAFAPHVVQYGTTLEVFIVDTNGILFVLVQINNVWSPSGWVSRGGSLGSQPTGVVWGNNNVDAFGMGTDFSCERNF